jgi:hypothetical protein
MANPEAFGKMCKEKFERVINTVYGSQKVVKNAAFSSNS